MKQPPKFDPYRLLGVKQSATEQEITKAYRTLSQKWHPDKNPGDAKAEEKYKRIQDAYEILSDAEKRRHWDETGEAPSTANRRGPADDVVEVLAAAFDQTLGSTVARGIDPTRVRFIPQMRQGIQQAIRHFRDKFPPLEAEARTLTRLVGRITTDEPDNYFEGMIRGKLHHIEQQRRGWTREITKLEAALEYLAKCRVPEDAPGMPPSECDSMYRVLFGDRKTG